MKKKIKKMIPDGWKLGDRIWPILHHDGTKYLQIELVKIMPKWILIEHEDNMVHEVLEESTNYYKIRLEDELFVNRLIHKSNARIATKAEIKAHKLGFHIGDIVYGKFYGAIRGPITGFKITSSDLYCNYDSGCDRLSNLTKTPPKPKLFLGDKEVEIIFINGLNGRNIEIRYGVFCKVAIQKKDWMQWYYKFVNVWPNVEYCEMSLGGILVKLYKQENYISIDNIDKITYEQIQTITERLNQAI